MGMRKMNIICLLLLSCLTAFAQPDKRARDILDKAAAAFRKAGGINAKFSVAHTAKNGTATSPTLGNIRLKGDRFLLEAGNVTTWFDGNTQWSYLSSGEEVNVSHPTPEELQNINPYRMLNSYQKGYHYKYAGEKSRQGKNGYEVILTPKDEKKDPAAITLFVSKSYQPVYIKIEGRDGSKNEIIVMAYQTGQNYSDALFRFDPKKYPQLEIIDLR